MVKEIGGEDKMSGFELYKPKIQALQKALEEEGIIKEDIRPIAIIAVLVESYGMGDAWAGMLLIGFGKHDTTKEIAEIYGYNRRLRDPINFMIFMDHVIDNYKSNVLKKYMRGGKL